MKTKRCVGAWALIAAVVLSSLFWLSTEMSAQSAPLPQAAHSSRSIRPGPSRCPSDGSRESSAACASMQTTTSSSCRARTCTRALRKSRKPAPPVMEFDQAGNVVNSWGDRQVMAEALHGCSFDAQGNIWIAGNGDGFIQKYSRDGKLLLQIGVKGKVDSEDGTLKSRFLNASPVAFYSPTEVAVDPANGDVFVADGYGNKRVVVFDKTGKFLRQWGRQGTTADAAAGVGGAFVNIVHCVVMANDGLLYVCDRNGDRIQVFDKTGAFKRNIPMPILYRAPYTGNGTAGSLAFSRDAAQKYMLHRRLQRQSDSRLRSSLGKGTLALRPPGQPPVGRHRQPARHCRRFEGNLYVAESLDGRRVQRFKQAGGGTPTAAR